jgi:hypothetical protein
MRHPATVLKPVSSILVLLLALLAPGAASGQAVFDPWVFWTEVSVHQLHLPNDQILFWAYSGFSAWLWDPAAPVPFIEVPNLDSNTFCSGHAGLADGSYLVGGGIDLPTFTSDAADIFDVSTNPGTWIPQATMAAERFYPTLTTLGDGRVIAIGGTGSFVPEIFDPAANTWTPLPGALFAPGVYPFMFLLPDGRLFFSGPSTNTGTLDIGTQTWTFGIPSVNDGASAVMYAPGKVMKCGGFAVSNALTETIDMNAATPAWAPASNMAFERHDHSLTILPNGKVVAVGGHDSADVVVLPAEEFDPRTGTWTTTASLGIPRQYHSTSMLLRDGRVLVGGGDGFASVEIYNPDYVFAASRPAITSVTAQITYGQTFNLKWTAKSLIRRVTFVRLGAETHSFDQNQRFMDLASVQVGPIGATPGGTFAGTLGVTAPANGNVAPPGYYMIFAVDQQGVPSVGEYVRIN